METNKSAAVSELIEIQRQNQQILLQMESNQQAIFQENREHNRRKIFFEVGKYAIWIFMIIASFKLTQAMGESLKEGLFSFKSTPQAEGLATPGTQDLGNLIESLLR